MVWSLTLSTVISALMSETVVSFSIPGTNSCPSPLTATGDFDPEILPIQFIFDIFQWYYEISKKFQFKIS